MALLLCTECGQTEVHEPGCNVAEFAIMATSEDAADRAFAGLLWPAVKGKIVEVEE